MTGTEDKPYAAPGLRVAAFRAKKTREHDGREWTQTDLAYWLGTTQARVSRIETGYERPTRQQALMLAEHANIAIRWWGYA